MRATTRADRIIFASRPRATSARSYRIHSTKPQRGSRLGREGGVRSQQTLPSRPRPLPQKSRAAFPRRAPSHNRRHDTDPLHHPPRGPGRHRRARCIARRPGPVLARQAGQDHRGLPARRRGRQPGAPAGRAPDAGAGPERGGRQQGRRQRHHRHGCGGQVGAGRLCAGFFRRQPAGAESAPGQVAVRSGPGHRTRGQRDRLARAAAGHFGAGGQGFQGADRRRQGQARCAAPRRARRRWATSCWSR